jgi:hypothetical protein
MPIAALVEWRAWLGVNHAVEKEARLTIQGKRST